MTSKLLLRSLALASALLLALAGPAFGHALYERSEPASGAQLVAPGQIQVWFTEEVEPSFSKLEVLDSSRKRVDLDDRHPAPGDRKALIVSVGELPDGTYTVSRRALSAVDGHVTRGVFALAVGAGGPTGALEEAPAYVPEAGDIAARWLGYLAALALAGGFLSRLAVLAPALATSGGAGGRATCREPTRPASAFTWRPATPTASSTIGCRRASRAPRCRPSRGSSPKPTVGTSSITCAASPHKRSERVLGAGSAGIPRPLTPNT